MTKGKPKEPPTTTNRTTTTQSRERHTNGPDWRSFLISTPTAGADHGAEEEYQEVSFPETGHPQWDGDPETWEAYQNTVAEYLTRVSQAATQEEAPQRGGDPDTWERYRTVAQAWVENRRERSTAAMSASSSQA
jgi:hypothetical protein